jgi:hypothetical protein
MLLPLLLRLGCLLDLDIPLNRIPCLTIVDVGSIPTQENKNNNYTSYLASPLGTHSTFHYCIYYIPTHINIYTSEFKYILILKL